MARNVSDFEWHIGSGMAQGDPPFYALLVALVLRADSTNLETLREAFPEDVDYIQHRTRCAIRWNNG